MRPHSTLYTLGFAAAVCIVCSLLVSTAAVKLHDRQQVNALLDKRENVLLAAGLVQPGETVSAEKVDQLFQTQVHPVIIDLRTGEQSDAVDPKSYDQLKAAKDPSMSREANPNNAHVARIPFYGLVYEVMKDNQLDMVVLPIEGKGLWSTLYGFLALDADTTTVRGITYYQHGETPGLGGEVDNPKWKALWPGRKAYDENWQPKIQLIKGRAGSPKEDPYHVDGLSGATLTSRGVSAMLMFWLGDEGYGPFLKKIRDNRGVQTGGSEA